MSSAIGGLSAAKRRRGSGQSTIGQSTIGQSTIGQSTIGQRPPAVNQSGETRSMLKQVTPIEMLKIHESRLCRIESMDMISKGGSLDNVQEMPDAEYIEMLVSEIELCKKKIAEYEGKFVDINTTLMTLQTFILTTTQQMNGLKSDLSSLKTDSVVSKMSSVVIGSPEEDETVEGVDKDDDNIDDTNVEGDVGGITLDIGSV